MTERLKNIINGINNGSIKDTRDLNLTKEEFLTKDENGVCLLEHLFNNDVKVSIEDKGIKSDVEIIYMFLKNDQPLYWLHIDEKALFSVIDGKRLIDHILENEMIVGGMVRAIENNIEIVDLLCKYHEERYLDSLNPKIIKKLVTKNNDGTYPIEKYVHNEKVIRNIFESTDILNDNNFSIKDFIKVLVDNKMFELLLDARETIFLLEIYPSKTLLEILIDNGYNPDIYLVQETKTINILYKLKRLDLLKDVNENILLLKINNIFNDDSLEDKTLLEYLIDNNYDARPAHIFDINIIKMAYQKERPDLLVKANTKLLLTSIENDYTYLDYVLECIKQDKLKYNVAKILPPSEIEDKVKFYLTMAKHDMIAYIEEDISLELLLRKHGDKTLIEYLLDADSKLTLDRILNDKTRSHVDIAFILKSRGIKQDDIDFSLDELDKMPSDGHSINKAIIYGPLEEEGEILLNELQNLFLYDKKSDKELIKILINGYRNALIINYDINIVEIKNLIEIKKQNLDMFCYIKSDTGDYFLQYDGSVYCANTNTNTLLHETGHALHFYMANTRTPDDYQDIIKRTRSNPEMLAKIKNFTASYEQLVNNVILLVKQRYSDFFDNYYSTEKVEEIKKNLIKSKTEKKEKYKDLQIPEEQLDIILDDMYTPEEYIKHQKRIFIVENVEIILRNEFGSLFSIGDILDAIYEGGLYSGILKNSQGENVGKTGGHGVRYYYATDHGFDEMIANFSAISKASDAEEKLQMLKSIVGDEVYNMISNFYYHDILKINLEEVKTYGGKR